MADTYHAFAAMLRHVAFVLLILCSTSVLGQGKLVPQHSGSGTADLVISPSGNLFVTVRDHSLQLWDARSGRHIRSFRGEPDPLDLRKREVLTTALFLPDESQLVFGGTGEKLHFWNLKTDALQGSVQIERPLRSLAVSSTRGVLVASDAKGLLFINIQDRSTSKRIAVPSGKVRFLDGSSKIAVTDFWSTYIFEVSSSKLLSRISPRGPDHGGLTCAIPTPDGQAIVSVHSGIVAMQSVNASSTSTKLDEILSENESCSSIQFSDAESHFWIGSDAGNLTLYAWERATRTAKRIRTIQAGGRHALAAMFPGSSNLLVASQHSAHLGIWDPNKETQIADLSSSELKASNAFGVQISADGRKLAWGTAHGAMICELRNCTNYQKIGNRPAFQVHFSADGASLLVMYRSFDSRDKTVELTEWSVVTTDPPKLLRSQVATEDSEVLKLYSQARIAQSYPTWNELFISLAHHFDLEALVRKDRDRFIESGEKIVREYFSSAKEPQSAAISRSGRFTANFVEEPQSTVGSIEVYNRETRTVVAKVGRFSYPTDDNTASRMPIRFSPDERYLAYRVFDVIHLRSLADGRTIALEGHLDLVASLAFSNDGKLLISAGWDCIRIWDVHSAKELAAIASVPDIGVIVYTPHGFYQSSSEKIEDVLSVREGLRSYRIDQFRERFFRPDLVRASLSGRSLEEFGAISAIKPAPTIELGPLPSATGQRSLRLEIRVRDSGGGIGNLRVYQNGTAVNELRLSSKPSDPSPNGIAEYLDLQLAPGKNEIRVTAHNAENSMESVPARAEVTATHIATRPSLYALVIGIDRFKNPKLDLNFSGSDAKAFSNALRRGATGIFDRVHIEELTTSEQTTKEAILRQFLVARQQPRPEDVFVLFVASHGIIDDGTYYLATSNVGSVSSQRLSIDALSQNDLRAAIATIPSTKKLIILDTCHSGRLGEAIMSAMLTRGLNEETAAKLLARAVGATILAGSTSAQQALEGYRNHGLFTYALVEGLAGKADRNKDGFVTTTELLEWVEEEVSTIALKQYGHRQYPTPYLAGQPWPIVRTQQ
jgi:WD40 repeat protein